MMDNELHELSKPTAQRNKFSGRLTHFTETSEPEIYENLYSQSYVSALLQHIADLESYVDVAALALSIAELREYGVHDECPTSLSESIDLVLHEFGRNRAELETKRQRIAELERDSYTRRAATLAMRDSWREERSELQTKMVTLAIKSADSDPQRENFGCNALTTDSGTFYITRLGSVPGREMALYRNEAEALFIGLRDALSTNGTVEGDE